MSEQTQINENLPEINTADFDVIIKAGRSGFVKEVKNVWQYRELFFFLVWRDVKVRYKQSILGILWAIIKPVVSMIIFTVIFGKVIGIDKRIAAEYNLDASWYPLFIYTAMLPWTYFSGSLTTAGNSLVSNANLITKVYFPRIIIPASAALSGVVDFFFALFVMGALMVWFGAIPSVKIFAIIPLLALTYMTIVGVGLLFSAINVRFRDASYVLGFVVSIWMYLTPVIYPLKIFKDQFQSIEILLFFNPMTGIIEGFRWAFIPEWPFPSDSIGMSVLIIMLMLIIGNGYFRRVERTFADVV